MTRFWPMSYLLNSPALSAGQKLELQNYRLVGISTHTLRTCRYVLNQMQSEDITIMHSEGAPFRRVYLKHPTQENWLALEREIFLDFGDGFGLNVDRVH